MIQLSYEPAFDPYHAVFRMLRILSSTPNSAALKFDQLRILDFYLLFPMLLIKMRLPRQNPLRDEATKLSSEKASIAYAKFPLPISIFRSMTPFQDVAIKTLSARGYLDSDKMNLGIAALAKQPIPEELAVAIEARNAIETSLMRFIAERLASMPLEGEGGLKDRSGLMEYRYDVI